MGKLKDPIPAKPFADWLNHRYEQLAKQQRLTQRFDTSKAELGAKSMLCRELGWPETDTGLRRLHRFRAMISESAVGRKDQNVKYKRSGEQGPRGTRKVVPAETFSRQMVEEALHHAGIRLGEIYPYEALVDEMQMEYLVPRDQAVRLADAWIERVWQTVWQQVGLYVTPDERPRAYCRSCAATTAKFMGVCEECCAPVEPVLVAAAAEKWTRERIVVAIQDWAHAHGRAPRIADFPSLNGGGSVVARFFGSWNGALAAAGLGPNQDKSQETYEAMRDAVLSGERIVDIAARFGVSKSAVLNRLKAHGTPVSELRVAA